MRLPAVLLAALVLAGCASSEKLDRLRGVETAPEPYYKQYEEDVDASVDKTYAVDVKERATVLNATLALLTRSGGVASAAPSPAQLTLQVTAPSGAPAGTATVDAQRPAATVRLAPPAERGAYAVRVTGAGVSGAELGASYVLALEVEYA